MHITVDILSKLIPNPITALVQLCSTLVLFLLVKKFLWKPIQNFFHAREDKLQADLTAGETARKEAETDRAAAAEQLNEASRHADEIVSAAVSEARTEKESILNQAHKEAEGVQARAQEQIARDRAEMVSSVKNDMVDIAMEAAGKLIGSKADSEMDREAVQAYIKEAEGNEK